MNSNLANPGLETVAELLAPLAIALVCMRCCWGA